jgi:hypothetical protein
MPHTIFSDRSWDGIFSCYSIVLLAGWLGFDSEKGKEIFLNSTASKPALGSTHPPIAWVMGSQSSQGVMLTTHIHI